MFHKKVFQALMLLLSAWACALGCSGCSGESKKPVFPARGKVLYQKSRPAEGALVIFTPSGAAAAAHHWPNGFPRATAGKDGAFSVTTYAAEDGIPAGDYAVTLTWRKTSTSDEESRNPDALGSRYADPAKAHWKVTIQAGENTLPTFFVQ